MEQPKTSFIPKKPLESFGNVLPQQMGKARARTLFYLITILIFILTIATLAGVFLFKFALQKRINAQVDEMQEIKKELDGTLVEDARRLSHRINNSEVLLNSHLSPSEIFSMLEEYTLHSVSFNNFTFRDTKDGMVEIVGSGIAGKFESIILQSDSFAKTKAMKNILFSNLQPNSEDKTMTFTFSAFLDPEKVFYRTKLKNNPN